ncbi:MAG: EVE domain-containing protein [Rhodospirillales bacterium]|nr:EVE domain-containing protein [Rhodospirillales bacterium]
MNYWLIKSEPSTWSWADHVKKGIEHWDGVRNYQASNNMKAMKIGDKAFFYHSVKEKQIVGIVEVVKEYYPDHTDPKGRFGMVDFKAIEPLKNPVNLEQIKADPRLQDLALIKQSRLSVMPIGKKEWDIILGMSR